MEGKGKEKKNTGATKKTTVKEYWYPLMPMWTFILILILIGIFLGVALMGGIFVYRINKNDFAYNTFKNQSEVQATTETSSQQSVIITSVVTGKPSVIEPGFNPNQTLIDISNKVNLPEIPVDSIIFKDYRIFPDIEGIWGKPRAGYNDGFNDEFSSSDRLRNVQIPTWKWLAFTGEEGWWPGVGSLKDPDGGAILLVVINVWETPGEFQKAYLLHGFWAFGEVWDMSDMLDNGNNTAPKYGQYTLETMATIRNHYINQLGSTEPNPEFRGQTGKATQAETITWACVLRWYDGSFRLVDSGQWVRGQ